MKKSINVLIGILSPVFFHLVMHLMMIWDYNEKYSILQNAMLYILPAIPGVFIAFFFIRNSLSDFIKSFGIYFLTYVCVVLIFIVFRVDLMIHTHLTGYEEFAMGEGFLMAVMWITYTTSCFCGFIVAGIISFCKQRKNSSTQSQYPSLK